MNTYLHLFKHSRTAVKIFSALLTISGAVTLIIFLGYAFSRNLNFGTYAGIGAGVLCTLLGLLMPAFISSECRAARYIYTAALGLFCALAAYACILSGFMLGAMLNAPEADSDRTVIVLGCQVRRDGPSLMLTRRLEAAYDYLCENPSADCIVAGGQGDNEHISEAQAMYDWLVEKGIDKTRITKEDNSESTLENLKFSKSILESEGRGLDVILVTDGFHQLRASLMAGELGYDVRCISSATPYYLVPLYVIREWLALSYSLVFGYA